MNSDLFEPYRLDGRVALVTGGTGGIGRACIERLHAFGATIATTFVPGVETPDKVHHAFPGHDRITAHPLDLASAASVRDCYADVLNEHRAVDILINNAAVGSGTVKAISDDPDEQDSMMLSINADGTLKMCNAFLAAHDGSQSRNRKLINISSVGGGIGVFPGFRLSDGMSKAAVAFLTRQIASETVHRDIDVFAVCPGATNTAMFAASTLSKMSPEACAAFEEGLPKGRLIKPDEIAAIIHFLATDLSTAMHGAVIDASMGLGVRPGLMPDGV